MGGCYRRSGGWRRAAEWLHAGDIVQACAVRGRTLLLGAGAGACGLVLPVCGKLCLQLGQLEDQSGVHVEDVLPCLHGQPLNAGAVGEGGLSIDCSVWGQHGAWLVLWAACRRASMRVVRIALP